MKRWIGYLTLLGCALCTIYTMLPVNPQTPDHSPFNEGILISHAGGGLKEGSRTNSLESLDKAVQNGFIYIEIDFHTTKNGELVLLHDWKKTYVRLFTRFPRLPKFLRVSKVEKSKTASDFKSLKMQHGLTQLSLDDLIVWMSENPNICIITDIKGDNIMGLTQIRDTSGDLKDRFIPQIYYLNEYADVKNLGFDDIILSTYKMKSSVSELGEFLTSNKLFALTIPKSWTENEKIGLLPEMKTPILTHTINSSERAKALMAQGVRGIYTDYLYPEASNH